MEPRHILLDTNILRYIGTPEIIQNLLSYLVELQNKYVKSLAISQITIFELLDGIPVAKESKARETLSNFTRLLITEDILLIASNLSSLYKQEKIPVDQISVCDKLIAASAVLNSCYILTGDGNDYPRPFFVEVETKPVYYTKGNKLNMQYLFLLEVNPAILLQRDDERNEKNIKQKSVSKKEQKVR